MEATLEPGGDELVAEAVADAINGALDAAPELK
jgi:hypothetical protein